MVYQEVYRQISVQNNSKKKLLSRGGWIPPANQYTGGNIQFLVLSQLKQQTLSLKRSRFNETKGIIFADCFSFSL